MPASVVEHHILLGELQQHRITSNLADAHVFQALQSVRADANESCMIALCNGVKGGGHAASHYFGSPAIRVS